MKITRDGDQLILTTGDGRPWASSLFTVLFVGGITTTITVGLLMDLARDGFSVMHLAGVLIPIVLFAFARMLRDAHHATVRIDDRFGRVSIERRYLFKTLVDQLRFDEVIGFAIHETDDDGSPRYQLKLDTTNGRTLILGQRESDRSALDEAVAAVAALK